MFKLGKKVYFQVDLSTGDAMQHQAMRGSQNDTKEKIGALNNRKQGLA